MRREAAKPHNASHVVVLDIETIVPNPPPGAGDGFVKWPHHHPVVASLLTATALGNGCYDFELDSIVCEGGQEREFYAAVNERIPRYGTCIGFYSAGFDISALAIGAIGARCFSADKLSLMHRANRFGNLHADLAELFSNYGAAPRPSLAEVCGRLGVPVKLNTHGSEVAELHERGEIQIIVDYCESDVAATYAAWLHWVAWRDGDDAALAEPLAAFSRWIEASPKRAHLLPIAQSEPAKWARSRALVLSLGHARDHALRRVTRERLDHEFSEDRSFASGDVTF
jgi:hypothetical protein